MNKISLVLLVSGTLMVIIATVISTVWLPKIDNSINKLNGVLDGFYGERERLMLAEIYNGQNKVKRRIDFLELNINKSDKEAQKELAARILNEKIDFITSRINHFRTDEKIKNGFLERLRHVTNVNEFDKKLEQLDQLESESNYVLQENLTKIQNDMTTTKSDIDQKMDYHSKIFSIFQWLQILGLIIISTFTIIEKYTGK